MRNLTRIVIASAAIYANAASISYADMNHDPFDFYMCTNNHKTMGNNTDEPATLFCYKKAKEVEWNSEVFDRNYCLQNERRIHNYFHSHSLPGDVKEKLIQLACEFDEMIHDRKFSPQQ